MKTNTYAYSDVYFISAKFHDEIGFDDMDYTTNYFDPTAEEIDMEIEIADLLNRIDSDCVSLLDEDN